MTYKKPETAGIAELEAALDIYGADRTRWPAPLRHTLSSLIVENEDARRLVAEAECFERLLDQAPGPSAERLALLTDRIVEAAERLPRLAASSPGRAFESSRARPRTQLQERGFVGAALAASLLLGVLAGQTGPIGPAAEYLIGGTESADALSGAQIARSDELEGLLDEDLL